MSVFAAGFTFVVGSKLLPMSAVKLKDVKGEGRSSQFVFPVKNADDSMNKILIVSNFDENNIRDIYLNNDDYKDGFRVTINLYNPVEIDNGIEYSEEFSIQIINNGNSIEITVINNYESEEEIYEARFSEHGNLNQGKWS